MDRRQPRAGWLKKALLVVFALGLFGCDHATKVAAKATLGDGHPVDVAPRLFGHNVQWHYTENDDVAFSLLRTFSIPKSPAILIAAATVAVTTLAFIWLAARRKQMKEGGESSRRASLLTNLGFAAVLGGALGNLTDRIVRGAVIDFIHVKHWPVFNVADIAVVLGMGLVVLGLRKPRDPAAPAAPGAPSPPTSTPNDGAG
jgi:signal peptidase II